MNYIISEAFDKLKQLEEDRFSYDKEQEFTSKSTAHGNGVANKGQGRVPMYDLKMLNANLLVSGGITA